MNIAIVSPSQNAYSETFIQAHKKLRSNNFFYFGGTIPAHLEGQGYVGPSLKLINRIIKKFKSRLFPSILNDREYAFYKSLKKNKISAVLAEYGTTGADLVKVCKYANIPLYVHFHGYDASVTSVVENNQKKYIEMFSYATKIFVVSEVMKSKLLAIGCREDKLCLNHYGPNDIFAEIQPKYTERKSFMAIGRFVNKKAPYYSILAIKKVAEKHPDVKLYMAGDGSLQETCNNLISAFNLQDNVKLVGVITPPEYADYLAKVSGFIQHSITAQDGDMEGTPLAILEASAAGLPVISTIHAGIPDVIVNGETGLLVDEHDVDGMANNIIKIIENPDLAQTMGQKGKQRIKDYFSMDRHLRTLEEAMGIK